MPFQRKIETTANNLFGSFTISLSPEGKFFRCILNRSFLFLLRPHFERRLTSLEQTVNKIKSKKSCSSKLPICLCFVQSTVIIYSVDEQLLAVSHKELNLCSYIFICLHNFGMLVNNSIIETMSSVN